MLNVEGLNKSFLSNRITGKRVHVLKDISLHIDKGETLGLVGDSGSGKTTLARCILRLTDADSGRVFLNKRSVMDASKKELKQIRQKMQIIFQHPYSSLNPKRTIRESLVEAMTIHNMMDHDSRITRVHEILAKVELHDELLPRYPHQLSGGQLQRVVIARALSLNPSLLILDEPTSMLDISIQASILHLLKDLQREFEMAYLFISHNKDVTDFISHRQLIIKEGKIMEPNGPE